MQLCRLQTLFVLLLYPVQRSIVRLYKRHIQQRQQQPMVALLLVLYYPTLYL